MLRVIKLVTAYVCMLLINIIFLNSSTKMFFVECHHMTYIVLYVIRNIIYGK